MKSPPGLIARGIKQNIKQLPGSAVWASPGGALELLHTYEVAAWIDRKRLQAKH
jgi:hypothetical protein